ncbi:MAG: glutamine--fructose-6-phosphate transaminase (isomerizing) [Nanoarchaeota archaeon]
MCGIIGYLGLKEANPILVAGLERLEYRGYDSAGICTAHNGALHLHKKKGRVEKVREISLPGSTGIAHTRWSTHGSPSDRNAHPFLDNSRQFAIVHNGIIENHLELKEELRREGIDFSSETDSEVIVHLVAKYYAGDLTDAIRKTVQRLVGAYAFCVLKNDGLEIVAARNGSPLVVGLNGTENFLASDVSALIEHTRQVVYLDDFRIVRIAGDGVHLIDFQGKAQPLQTKEVNWNIEQAQKQGYKHFMLKEIFEQPRVVEDSLRAEMLLKKDFNRLIIVACGTANYAGLVGKYLIEKIAKIPVTVEIASEFRYKEPLFSPDDLVLAISQSGETADTLAAVRLAKEQGARTLGLINVVDSTIAREADQVIYTRAGPEIGVASTKAFTAQLVTLYKMAYALASQNFPGRSLKEKIEKTLSLNHQLKALAQKYFAYQNFLYIGRNINYPLALEGALKLKEISYIHAEAYPAGELKHGPLALVSEDTPTLAICPQDAVYEKTLNNIEEVKARNGKVIVLATEGDERIKKVSDDIIYIPKIEEIFYPLLTIIPLQLLAYHVADVKECDVDKPRNLAKSCTVE